MDAIIKIHFSSASGRKKKIDKAYIYVKNIVITKAKW